MGVATGRAAAGTVPPWRSVEVVAVTGSTNADLVRAARAGAAAPAALAARHQTGGRGRLDRAWSSPPGASLSLSLLWRPAVPRQRWTWVPALVGLAVVDAVAVLGAAAGLKWPNDVVVPVTGQGPGVDPTAGPERAADGRGALGGLAKLAGVLVEVVGTPDGPAVVAGVGLNLGQELLELPVSTATSLRLVLGGPAPGFDEALDLVLGAAAGRFRQWEADPTAVRADYVAACTTLGRTVSVRGRGDAAPVQGRAVGVADDAGLVVETAAGRQVVAAGDVEHVR